MKMEALLYKSFIELNALRRLQFINPSNHLWFSGSVPSIFSAHSLRHSVKMLLSFYLTLIWKTVVVTGWKGVWILLLGMAGLGGDEDRRRKWEAEAKKGEGKRQASLNTSTSKKLFKFLR